MTPPPVANPPARHAQRVALPVSRARRAALLAALLLAHGGCAHIGTGCAAEIATISPAQMTRIELPTLQCLADEANPRAQLELGKRLEEGRGVPADPEAAAHWYGRAAGLIKPLGPHTMPALWSNGRLASAAAIEELRGPPLAEARYRLGRLYLDGRGVRQDVKRGRALIAEAAARGYAGPGGLGFTDADR